MGLALSERGLRGLRGGEGGPAPRRKPRAGSFHLPGVKRAPAGGGGAPFPRGKRSARDPTDPFGSSGPIAFSPSPPAARRPPLEVPQGYDRSVLGGDLGGAADTDGGNLRPLGGAASFLAGVMHG